MNCKKCNKPLEEDDKKICPRCKIKKDEKIKRGVVTFGFGLLGVIVGIFGTNKYNDFKNSSKNNKNSPKKK